MQPGFAIIHANHLEDLTALTVDWLKQQPLQPLQQEVFLVQSNGMAQWLKLALADDAALGISAAQQFQMPIRFLWQAYRTVLGSEQVPHTSPFDKSRLHWRIMRLLPELLRQEAFLPLQRFLTDGDTWRKRYQLSERLADLFDQYQVYRADWLADWEAGNDQLSGIGNARALGDNDRWQAILWRQLVNDMAAEQQGFSRSRIHQRFLDRLDQDQPVAGLPPRIVVFGITSLPQQVLEALYALSRHLQVIMLVQNPCRHYWADVVEDRHLLRIDRHRHITKPGLEQYPQEHQHRFANPLLAAWGKQGRDYISLLYNFDAPEKYQQWFTEIDLFDEVDNHHRAPGSLLAQIQQAVLDLEPLPASDSKVVMAADSSIEFHLAHSRQREVEILHDQLLRRLRETHAQDADAALRPRDILVMVPDIQAYAPHIEAVFGNLEREDSRYIPFTISDRSQRHNLPLAIALEKMLDLPASRFTVSDLLDLLEVPALRKRFDLGEQDISLLHQWIHGSGIRWGLSAQQRSTLGLPDGLHMNSWLFGLRRMLLGYCSGGSPAWAGIEPYDEIGGLEATLAGNLVQLLEALHRQWQALSDTATPGQWVQRIAELQAELFQIEEPDDLMLQTTLTAALEDWRSACDEAGFDEAMPLSVAREPWLSALDSSRQSQRFLAGRVNFCTLMPMRSIPFPLVCLLGMNDGDYPRSPQPLDFDLMARTGQYRPGDRSRREDDRYLFLEALLSARQQLYISWAGRSVRNNEEQPPSVLVAQLRDYINDGWLDDDGESMLEAITTVHPLQPFSHRYFMAGNDSYKNGALVSYAREWHQALHDKLQAQALVALPAPVFEQPPVLSPARLGRFLRQPAQLFFQERLGIRFEEPDLGADDAEPFDLDALQNHQLVTTLLDAASHTDEEQLDTALAEALDHWRGAGLVPTGVHGNNLVDKARDQAVAAMAYWHPLQQLWHRQERIEEVMLTLSVQGQSLTIEHWLDDLRHHSDGRRGRIKLQVGDPDKKPWTLCHDWLVHLAACAAGIELHSIIIGDKLAVFRPLDADTAHRHLEQLLNAWLAGLQAPLPVACKSAFAWLNGGANGEDKARDAFDGGFNPGERAYDMALARAWEKFDDMLSPAFGNDDNDPFGNFGHWTRALYQPLLESRELLKGIAEL